MYIIYAECKLYNVVVSLFWLRLMGAVGKTGFQEILPCARVLRQALIYINYTLLFIYCYTWKLMAGVDLNSMRGYYILMYMLSVISMFKHRV